MRINAKTSDGKKVFIVQFIVSNKNKVWAITVDEYGDIKLYRSVDLTVIDGQYLR